MPQPKTPAQPEKKQDQPDAPNAPNADATGNGPVEPTDEQMVQFMLNKGLALKSEKEAVYKRITSNREILRGMVDGATDEQKKAINDLYPMKKGGGRKKAVASS